MMGGGLSYLFGATGDRKHAHRPRTACVRSVESVCGVHRVAQHLGTETRTRQAEGSTGWSSMGKRQGACC